MFRPTLLSRRLPFFFQERRLFAALPLALLGATGLAHAQSAATEAVSAPAPHDSAATEAEFSDDEELEFSATAEVEAPEREPTKHTVDKELLTRIPGTRGDALRAVEIMPGVSRTPYASSDQAPLLRGSSGDESLVLLDGAPVPLIYHFGGLTSFFNSHLLERVDLYPGNYSARYGRAAGGVVEVRVRDPRTDGIHARLELSAIDSQALVEAPVGKDTSVALAARRSNIDFFFKALVPEDAFSVLAAPVYWDYQAIVAHRFNDRHKLRALVYGSSDSLSFMFGDSAPEDPALRGALDAKLSFHRAQLEAASKFSESVEQNLMLSVGPYYGHQAIGGIGNKFDFWDINLRSEWSVFAHERARIDAGVDLQFMLGTGRYTGPAPSQMEGKPENDPLAGEKYVTVPQSNVASIRPAAYVEASLRPVEPWLIVPGVRVDYMADGQKWTVDPRLTSRLALGDSTTLKAGSGLYSQPPVYYQLLDEIGNPDLSPFRTWQSSFGVEERIIEPLSVSLEGFYKNWYRRIVSTEGGVLPRFENDGTGRAYGLETLIRLQLSPKSQLFLAYTLSRSERDDFDQGSRLFDSDQTHNLQFAGSYDLGRGWIVGARFRYVTGNPITPIVGSVYDAATDTYRAIYGPTNSERNPAFHQLDLRVEKLWQLGPVGLTTYLEVMNVYNRKNEEGVSYSYDFSESQGAVGMPIFPNLGLVLEY